jgi:hypothetical protein
MTGPSFLELLEARFRSPDPSDRLLQMVHGFDRFAGAGGAGDSPDGIERALGRLEAAGAGGIVVNVGSPGYLRNPAQWEILRRGISHARARGLAVWIYDEEGYPSGAAGGVVLEGHPELEALGLACRTVRVDGPGPVVLGPPDCRQRLVAALAWNSSVTLDLASSVGPDGSLHAELPPGPWTVQHFFEKPAYEGTHAEGNVHASRRYINVLDPRAVRRFIEVTHEAYARELGSRLGGAQAFFTDEPSLMSAYIWPLPPAVQGKQRIQDPLASTDRTPMVAWAPGLAAEFRRRAGYDLAPFLPDLFVDRGPGSRRVREDYRGVVAGVFADTYCGAITAWCESRGLASTGHVLVEESVLWHVALLGDLFALVRRMTWPGIDMLDSDPVSIAAGEGFMVARQVSSAAHLAGRQEVMCELSDWFMRNEGRAATHDQARGTANLLFLLGVTTIASYYDSSLAFYPEYTLHAARLRTLLTAGRHDSRVAVLYPARGVQGRYFPQTEPPLPQWQSADVQAVVAGWTAVCRTLMQQQVDFDCIDEQGLAEAEDAHGTLRVGHESYDTVVIPPTDRVGEPALAALSRLVESGGRLVLVADPAVLPLDGLPVHPRVLRVPDLESLERAVGDTIPRTVDVQPRRRDFFCTRHLLETGPLYYLVNNAPGEVSVAVSLTESGRRITWDPATGVVSAAVPYASDDPIDLVLPGFGSVFMSLS